MKYLKFKKIKIAKINNLSTILGGNNRRTFLQGCIQDTHTCPPKLTEDPNYTTCQITNNGTLAGNVTGAFDNSVDQCGG